MENQVILIGSAFDKDITDLDFETLIQPKLWPTLENTPAYTALDGEIIKWLENNTPETYRIILESSKRKAHDLNLINAIKAKILFEQLDYVGLRSLQSGRFFNLLASTFETVFKYVQKAYKKHDVKQEAIKFHSTVRRFNIDAEEVYCRYGSTSSNIEKLESIIAIDPDSKYLNLCKALCLEAQYLDSLRRSIETVTINPKDQSDYQTCACCFRWIRLQPSNRNKIAYHGYTLDRDGWHTDIVSQSCNGANFPPFQISADGTIDQLRVVRKAIEKSSETLAELQANKPALHDSKYDSRLRSIKNHIRNFEDYVSYALKRIEQKYPDRLEEAMNT